jgi:hypothetical protein
VNSRLRAGQPKEKTPMCQEVSGGSIRCIRGTVRRRQWGGKTPPPGPRDRLSPHSAASGTGCSAVSAVHPASPDRPRSGCDHGCCPAFWILSDSTASTKANR